MPNAVQGAGILCGSRKDTAPALVESSLKSFVRGGNWNREGTSQNHTKGQLQNWLELLTVPFPAHPSLKEAAKGSWLSIPLTPKHRCYANFSRTDPQTLRMAVCSHSLGEMFWIPIVYRNTELGHTETVPGSWLAGGMEKASLKIIITKQNN